MISVALLLSPGLGLALPQVGQWRSYMKTAAVRYTCIYIDDAWVGIECPMLYLCADMGILSL